ncbi:MAG: hypothetical protein GY821_12495, partial [Gammaproteobacteria bacterium]|nr:hypothetical protein [Gammaproteobacteria bacterium]
MANSLKDCDKDILNRNFHPLLSARPLIEDICTLEESNKAWKKTENYKNDSKYLSNRVESALTEPTLSHHGTCDVAYRGFKLAFNKTKNFALLGLGCYSMPE